jgi:3-oxoacyl-[acyl-carrier protein] reductase
METDKKKIVLVTGGTKGIGRSITLLLLKNHYNTLITYSSDDLSAKALKNELNQMGYSNFHILKADVSIKANINKIIAKVKQKWNASISHVVNNAGILKQGNFFVLKNKDWDKTFSVNLKGVFYVCQKLMPIMETSGGGSIVNIVSIGAQTGGKLAPDYAASKGALITFTQSMAMLGADMGIRVNAVSPGWIDTGIFTPERFLSIVEEAKTKIPLKRLGKPEEVAESVLFLLTKKANYITGQVLNVNGGMYF